MKEHMRGTEASVMGVSGTENFSREYQCQLLEDVVFDLNCSG